MLKKEEIEKLKKKFDTLPDEYFTADEGNEMNVRPDNLEKQMSDQFRENEIDAKKVEKQVEELRTEIEILKKTVFSLKKSGWLKSMATKLMTFMTKDEDRKLFTAGRDIVAQMLPSKVG